MKELVEMHKGTIGLESWVGKGSKFTILLPLGKEHFDSDTEFILTDIIGNEAVGDKDTAGLLISEMKKYLLKVMFLIPRKKHCY